MMQTYIDNLIPTIVNVHKDIMMWMCQNVQVLISNKKKGCSLYCLECVTSPSNCTSCNSTDFRELKVN